MSINIGDNNKILKNSERLKHFEKPSENALKIIDKRE